MKVLILWTVLLATIILKGYISASVIRKHSPSVFRIESIKKTLPLLSGGADFTVTAVIRVVGEPGETFNGRLLLFPLAANLAARPFEKQVGKDNVYQASMQVFNSPSSKDVGLDLVHGNESLLFSIKLDNLPLNVSTRPTALDESVSYMIYSYRVPKGMRYAIDIKPKIRAFRAFSLFSLEMMRDYGFGWRILRNDSLYSSGEVFDRYASITFDQNAMDADQVVIKKLEYRLMTWPLMQNAFGSVSAQSVYRII